MEMQTVLLRFVVEIIHQQHLTTCFEVGKSIQKPKTEHWIYLAASRIDGKKMQTALQPFLNISGSHRF